MDKDSFKDFKPVTLTPLPEIGYTRQPPTISVINDEREDGSSTVTIEVYTDNPVTAALLLREAIPLMIQQDENPDTDNGSSQ